VGEFVVFDGAADGRRYGCVLLVGKGNVEAVASKGTIVAGFPFLGQGADSHPSAKAEGSRPWIPKFQHLNALFN
jgi:hypothetical protein